ncbi:hypothetical protein [Kordia sp.]|uniref:hypothetical protein n=1 Tax=Kordia sp. TaxID=1965332 RepID=UPI003B58C2A5
MKIKEIYKKIIPSDNYQSRRDFCNHHLIDNLSEKEKLLIENMLIEDLNSRYDLLLIETLTYLNSTKSISVIEEKLKKINEAFDKIVIARCLYKLEKDKSKMIDLAYDNFLLITNDYIKITLFYYLVKFNSNKILKLVKSYTGNKNILLAHNSKAALQEAPRE